MALIQDIYAKINQVAPFSEAMDFDNVGLLVGDLCKPVNNVMIVLDITPVIIQEAIKENVELIISHHPVIFTPLKSLHSSDIAYQLIENHIAALCCHTNLDASPICGTNISLGKKIGLQNLRKIKTEDMNKILFVGELPAAESMSVFVQRIKTALQVDFIKCNDLDRMIRKVAICSGAGGDSIALARNCDVDAFVTGELKYHEELEAVRTDMAIVAAGHYETEVIFADELIRYLEEEIQGVNFLRAKIEKPPMRVK